MKTLYRVEELLSNFSDIAGVFDTEEEATDYIQNRYIAYIEENELDKDESGYVTEAENELFYSYFNIVREEATLDSMYPTSYDDGEFRTYGEDIIDTFYNGNFSQGVEQLREINTTAIEFGDYIANLSEEMGYEHIGKFAQGHFDYNFFICLGREAL